MKRKIVEVVPGIVYEREPITPEEMIKALAAGTHREWAEDCSVETQVVLDFMSEMIQREKKRADEFIAREFPGLRERLAEHSLPKPRVPSFYDTEEMFLSIYYVMLRETGAETREQVKSDERVTNRFLTMLEETARELLKENQELRARLGRKGKYTDVRERIAAKESLNDILTDLLKKKDPRTLDHKGKQLPRWKLKKRIREALGYTPGQFKAK